MNEDTLNKLQQLRDEAVMYLDTEKFREYCRALNAPEPSSEEVVLAGLHKARLHSDLVCDEGKLRSREWLTANGYSHTIASFPKGDPKLN
jgi:hypothetical protein